MRSIGPSGDFLGEDSIAEIIYRMQNLNLGDKSSKQEQNALVLYRGDGAVVPYESKKRKPRPKVDLDDETTRIWNLLMGKGEKEGAEEMDKKKEKWWEEERRVFRGRADSFIARMHLVQGEDPNTLNSIFIHIACLNWNLRHQLKLYPEITIIKLLGNNIKIAYRKTEYHQQFGQHIYYDTQKTMCCVQNLKTFISKPWQRIFIMHLVKNKCAFMVIVKWFMCL